MLRFVTRRKRLHAALVADWSVLMDVKAIGSPRGIRMEFKVDTQADYTAIPLSLAGRLGFDVDQLKRNGAKIRIGTACGGGLTAFLVDVEFLLEDDFSGWAQWLGQSRFANPIPGITMPARSGFFSFCDFPMQDLNSLSTPCRVSRAAFIARPENERSD